MNNKPLNKVLVANRSEVAARVITTCRALGLKTVAIFTQEDMQAPFVYKADEAGLLSQSGYFGYMNADEIISLAHSFGADSIHPGYGFLSEDEHFARIVRQNGLRWIGPHPDSMHHVSDKARAKSVAVAARVPVLSSLTIESSTHANISLLMQEIKDSVGYPIIIKDSLGGGGRNSEKISSNNELLSYLKKFLSQSKCKKIVVERYVPKGRHVEVQVAGDGKNFIHCFERDCSVQRRNQKVIEEAPCSFISEKLRCQLYKAALSIARYVSYDSIGTVEFLVDQEENFYFLEFNTRLQVEHGVTEMITGVDLVALQLQLSQGLRLPFKQADITKRGFALQCRVYAEDPTNNFLPSTGCIEYIHFPDNPFVRLEHSLTEGMSVSSFFDPMLSKLVSFGATREQAVFHMRDALKQYLIEGVVTNTSFLAELMATLDFRKGRITTDTLNKKDYVRALCATTKDVGLHDKEKELIALALAVYAEDEVHHVESKKSKRNDEARQRFSWKIQCWK